MRKVKYVQFRTLPGLLAGLMWMGSAGAYDFAPTPPGLPADAINTFRLYVADQETYDDNLFRVTPNTAGVPGALYPNSHQSDAVNTSTLGGQGRWDLGRQEVELDLRADENRFKDNTNLDFVSSNAVGTWNWRLGEYLSGQVQAFYDRSLAGFSETRFSGKDVVTTLEELGFARYQIGPHWAAYGQVRGSYLDHGAESQQYNDFHNKAGFAGVEYATDVNDTFAFEYSYLNITFRTDPLGFGAYNYDEDVEKFVAKYSISDKTTINGYAGYLERSYPGVVNSLGVSVPSYSGAEWRVNLGYLLTDKTQFVLSAWHELHAYIDAESNYFVAKGVSLAPSWTVTDKLSFTLLGSYEKQNYIGNSSTVVTDEAGVGTVVLNGAREDKVNSEQITLRYLPRERWVVNVFYRHVKRESNEILFLYNDNLVSGSVTYSFW